MKIIIKPKYYLITLLSEGYPHDKGINLINNKNELYLLSKPHFNNVIVYTPRIIRNLGYSYYVKERKQGVVYANLGLTKIGNGSYRPLMILLEMEKMNENDIIVYRDANLKKYPILKNYNNIKNIIDYCLKENNNDFFISREVNSASLKLKHFTKTNVLRELGENHPFSYEFPLCICNFLIFRKTQKSIKFLNEWKEACEKEEWIDGEIYGELHSEFKWYTPEQSLFNVIVANWIRKKQLPITFPNITFKNRDIYKIEKITDYTHLNFIN